MPVIWVAIIGLLGTVLGIVIKALWPSADKKLDITESEKDRLVMMISEVREQATLARKEVSEVRAELDEVRADFWESISINIDQRTILQQIFVKYPEINGSKRDLFTESSKRLSLVLNRRKGA